MRLNQEVLDIYSACSDADEVVARQNEWLEKAENDTTTKQGRHERRRNHWQHNDDEDGQEEGTAGSDSNDGERSLHGMAGELPPSDDEYYHDSEDEPELDKFGNIIEKSSANVRPPEGETEPESVSI